MSYSFSGYNRPLLPVKERPDNSIAAITDSFKKRIREKDPDTATHLIRMQQYSKMIAESLSEKSLYSKQIDRQFIENIYRFSPLHDIGKMYISDKILLKPGKLTHQEFEIVKNHTWLGAVMLCGIRDTLWAEGDSFFSMAIHIALCHHEKYNGQGYPKGLKGKDIPLAARIVSVADVFDALTSKRIYKEAIHVESAMEMIRKEAGISFDPVIVESFMKIKPEIIKVYLNMCKQANVLQPS